jgi:RNA polymerase sigma-70 factor (ECF subfamily)
VIPENAAARSVDTPDNVAEARELAEWLRAVLAELPERQSQVFALSCFSGLSNSEIAAALSITPGAVAMALHQARATIAGKHKSFAAERGVSEYERTT